MTKRREFPDGFTVKCARKGCEAELPTLLLQMRHADDHVMADRAMLRPSRRGSVDKNETSLPLRLTVGL